MISKSRYIDDKTFWIPSTKQMKIVTQISQMGIDELAQTLRMINDDVLSKYNLKIELKIIKGSDSNE